MAVIKPSDDTNVDVGHFGLQEGSCPIMGHGM